MENLKQLRNLSIGELFEIYGGGLSECVRELAEEGVEVSKATLSRLIRGVYPVSGNGKVASVKEGLIRIISKKLGEREIERIFQRRSEFKSRGQRLAEAVLNAAYEDMELSIIVGESGCGKTFLAQEFARNKKDVIYLKVRKNDSPRSLLRRICRVLGRPDYGSRGEILDRVIQSISDSEIRLILVDEADLMCRERSFEQKIEIFREIGEVCGVVLIGLPELERSIAERTDSYVFSRIGYHARMPKPEEEELFEFGRILGIEEEALVNAVRMAMGRGYFRTLQKVARRGARVGYQAACALIWQGTK